MKYSIKRRNRKLDFQSFINWQEKNRASTSALKGFRFSFCVMSILRSIRRRGGLSCSLVLQRDGKKASVTTLWQGKAGEWPHHSGKEKWGSHPECFSQWHHFLPINFSCEKHWQEANGDEKTKGYKYKGGGCVIEVHYLILNLNLFFSGKTK